MGNRFRLAVPIGRFAPWLFRPENILDFGEAWDIIYRAMDEGKCRMVYPPDMDIPGAVDALRESFEEDIMQNERFFLTETSLCYFLNERGHEDGDYWLFEIAYEDLGDMRKALEG